MTLPPLRPLPELRARRSSIKWRRYPEDVLPLFVAEMDYDIAPEIKAAVAAAIAESDTGYLDDPGPLAGAFARFALREWGWRIPVERIHLATDVTVGLVEALRLVVPPVGGRVVITPPVYAPFFEMIHEARAEAVEVPLVEASGWSLDLDGIERAFAAGADAMMLCHPQNPTGRCHPRSELETLARLAARYDVVVLSDEVHAPLTHPGTRFEPFAPIAQAAGARSATVTSASKGWNLAALKCALVIAGDSATAEVLDGLPEELAARTSLLGLHANLTALDCLDWRQAALERIAANVRLLTEELARHAPAVRVVPPEAGYLVWLDFRGTGLGDDPAADLIEHGRVALNSGPTFGAAGRGFARLNVACAPDTIVEAVQRIAATVEAAGAVAEPVAAPAQAGDPASPHASASSR